jgi:hypothetical protein
MKDQKNSVVRLNINGNNGFIEVLKTKHSAVRLNVRRTVD